MFLLVEELVVAEWKTLRNTHVNRPRELLRAIVIDALATMIKGSAEAAAAVWNTAVGPLRHQQVRLGKAGALVEKLLNEASRTAEAEAVSRATLAVPIATKPSGEKGPVENGKIARLARSRTTNFSATWRAQQGRSIRARVWTTRIRTGAIPDHFG